MSTPRRLDDVSHPPRSLWRIGFALGVVASAGAGCSVDVEIGRNQEVRRTVVLDTPARSRDKLDILFVIDNSSNMLRRQRAIASGFAHLLQSLTALNRKADLHIGVTSSDLGAGQFASAHTSCSTSGDGGVLLRAAECGLEQAFISSQTRSDAELIEAFECMAELGEAGCDYEQPIKAMKRALDGTVPTNDGFLRPSAALGVVIVTDEDDCSLRSNALLDPNNTSITGDAEWRCFSNGVRCGNGDDVFPPGWQRDCVAREDSSLVEGTTDALEFLRGLKGDPKSVLATGVIGDPDVVRVDLRADVGADTTLAIDPVCENTMGERAFPGVRLRTLFDSFGDALDDLHSSYTPLCRREPASGYLQGAATKLRSLLGSPCLQGAIVDVDGDRPGVQVDCWVTEIYPDRAYPVYACEQEASASQFPCFVIESDEVRCASEPSRLALRVVRHPGSTDLDTPVDARVRAECVIDGSPIIEVR